MTRQEFIDRTGFTPTEDHFKAILEEYMAAGDGVDKDTICERWLKNNGPQQVYDWMHSRLEGTEGELAAAKETNRELGNRIADLGDIIDSKDVEIGRLKDCIRYYRKALIIARLMLENLHEEADGEDLTMALDEIGAALAAGTGSKA